MCLVTLAGGWLDTPVIGFGGEDLVADPIDGTPDLGGSYQDQYVSTHKFIQPATLAGQGKRHNFQSSLNVN